MHCRNIFLSHFGPRAGWAIFLCFGSALTLTLVCEIRRFGLKGNISVRIRKYMFRKLEFAPLLNDIRSKLSILSVHTK